MLDFPKRIASVHDRAETTQLSDVMTSLAFIHFPAHMCIHIGLDHLEKLFKRFCGSVLLVKSISDIRHAGFDPTDDFVHPRTNPGTWVQVLRTQ